MEIVERLGAFIVNCFKSYFLYLYIGQQYVYTFIDTKLLNTFKCFDPIWI